MNKNNKEQDIQRLYKAQKMSLYWLLGIVYSGFIGLQLGRVQAIADFNYNLHEIMYVPFNIALFVTPILLLIYIYLFAKYLSKTGIQKINFKSSIKALLVIASIVAVGSITLHQSQEVSTAGVFMVEKKLHEDRKYYLILNDIKVRVTYNEFKLVEDNQQYLISFVWNKRAPNKGQLKTIEQIR
ncbi:MAG: hypothetical protein K0S34_1017 [Bacillales bacterium]|jgi:hypothetical protein|nr:hypothetical protein [Bacillales bacterium]